MHNNLISSIAGGTRNNKSNLRQRIKSGPIVDKFFVIGASAGIFGTLWLGTNLWLVLNGFLAPDVNYLIFKQAHTLVQIYLFFGLFLCGFALQAGPKLLEAAPTSFPMALIIIPLAIIGVIFGSYGYFLGAALISVAFLLPIIFLLPLTKNNSLLCWARMTGPLFIGFITLSIGPWLQLTIPVSSLFVVWFGIVSVIFAAGQQFIVGFLNGTRMNWPWAALFITCHVLNFVFFGFFLIGLTSIDRAVLIFASLALATISFWLVGTKLWRGIEKIRTDSIALAFSFGILWTIAAAVLLFLSPTYIDNALHLLATGLGMTLVFAVSARLLGFFSGTEVMKPKTLTYLIVFWQIVPFVRGLKGLLPVSPILTILLILSSTLVMATWIICVLRRVTTMIKKQLHLKKNEKMVQC